MDMIQFLLNKDQKCSKDRITDQISDFWSVDIAASNAWSSHWAIYYNEDIKYKRIIITGLSPHSPHFGSQPLT
jgi:hypothetical protein